MSIVSYIIITFIILFLDFIWLYLNANSYKKLVKDVQGSPLIINPLGASLSYLCVLSIFFYIIPIIKDKYKTQKNLFILSLTYAGSIGFLTYAIINTTNIAIFKNYNIFIALKDTLWGTFLFTISAYLFFIIDHKLK
jgi:uncharacterized membrane protein